MCMTVCIHLLAPTCRQITSILCTEKQKNQLKLMDVQMQAGGCDCGRFAVASAISLASGMLPGKYCSDQLKMHKYLYMCLQKGKLQNFPL